MSVTVAAPALATGAVFSLAVVNGGTLTEVPNSPTPLPTGGAPAGIVNI